MTRLRVLQLQVKQGAENMIQSLTSGRDKKLLQEAQQMLDDSRAKIEFLRMRIMKVRQARQQQHARGDAPPPNGETTSNKGTKLYPRPISRRVRIFNQRRTARTINYWPCPIQCVVVVSRGDWIVITGRIWAMREIMIWMEVDEEQPLSIWWSCFFTFY